MLSVDYEKRDPEEILRRHLRTVTNPEFSDDYIEALVNGEIDNDIVKGFDYGGEYSREVQYSYID